MFKALGPFLAWLASLLGIAGVSIANLLDDPDKSSLALAIFVVLCLLLFANLVWAIRCWQKQHYPKGYIPISTFVRYTTTDGKQVVYETFRQIQIKHAFLTGIEHRYKWSGSNPPVFTSKLQSVGSSDKDAKTGWDVVTLKFQQTRYLNDTEVVHLLSTLDDSDEKAETYCNSRIEHPLRLLHFRVELLHCSRPAHAGMIAHIERKKTTHAPGKWEPIDKVQFNLSSRSFEYMITDPEPEYQYCIRWDRPAINGKKPADGSGGKRPRHANPA